MVCRLSVEEGVEAVDGLEALHAATDEQRFTALSGIFIKSWPQRFETVHHFRHKIRGAVGRDVAARLG